MTGAIQEEIDYSISAIRFVAMFSIIACHIMQYLGCELAWWFNVGVQMFLCISGYLYGGKSIKNDCAFLQKTFSKILVDYYVVVIPVLALYFIFARNEISVSKVCSVLFYTIRLMEGVTFGSYL